MHNGTTSPRRPSHWVQAGDETAKPRESRGESPPCCGERRGLKHAASGVPRYPQTILLPNFLLNLVLWRRQQRWWGKPAAARKAKKLAGEIIACMGIIVDLGTVHVPPYCIRRRARAAAGEADQPPARRLRRKRSRNHRSAHSSAGAIEPSVSPMLSEARSM